jgi:hypothetical protein
MCVSQEFFCFTRNPQPSERATLSQAMPRAHALQRIIEFRAATQTHPVGAAVDCEHAAQIAVMATEKAIKRRAY